MCSEEPIGIVLYARHESGTCLSKVANAQKLVRASAMLLNATAEIG